MRCLSCGKTTVSSVTKKAHCWSSNQRCAKCHYLGVTWRCSVKAN
jgi:hypothetical protein